MLELIHLSAAASTAATHAVHELLYGWLCAFVKPRRLNADNLTPGVLKRFLAAIVVLFAVVVIIIVAHIFPHAVVLDFWFIVFAIVVVFVIVVVRLQNCCHICQPMLL